jgi:hypothetical protein
VCRESLSAVRAEYPGVEIISINVDLRVTVQELLQHRANRGMFRDFVTNSDGVSMLALCSFALLPLYIAWYLGREGERESLARAFLNGVLATLGGGTVMGAIGLRAALGIRTVNQLVIFWILG